MTGKKRDEHYLFSKRFGAMKAAAADLPERTGNFDF